MKSTSPPRKGGKAASGAKELVAEAKSVLDMIEAAGRPPDNMDVFAVLQKTTIEEARLYIDRLVREMERVDEESKVVRNEAFAVQEYFQAECETKDKKIEELETNLAQTNAELDSMKVSRAEEVRLLLVQAREDKARACEALNQQIQALQSELNSVAEFRKHQLEVEEECRKAKQETADMRYREKHLVPDLERHWFEQNTHLKKEYEQKLEQVKAELWVEIEERLTSRFRNILKENQRLVEELRVQIEGGYRLQVERDMFQSKNAILAHEMGLLKEAETLYIKRGNHQSKLIADNATKIENLEKSLRKVIRQYSAERRCLEDQHRNSITDIEAAHQALKRVILSQTKELKKVRRLASLVLKQRGEVEQFLIDSIQYVQAQKLLAGHRGDSEGISPRKGWTDHSKASTMLPSIQNESNKENICTLENKKVRFNSQAKKEHTLLNLFGHKKVDQPHAQRGAENSFLRRPPEHAFPQGRIDIRRVRPAPPLDQAYIDQFDQSELDVLAALGDQQPVRIKPKMDISQLTWGEREKVLRYVFNKMNAVHQQLVLPTLKLEEDDDDNMTYGSMSDSGRPNIV